jgi:hypothetical protein
MRVFTVVIRTVTENWKKNIKGDTVNLLNWCSGAGCIALGRFFWVGWILMVFLRWSSVRDRPKHVVIVELINYVT